MVTVIPPEFIALTLETLGGVFVAYAALRVHHRVLHDHKISEKAFRTMKREQRVGVFGVTMIIVGYSIDAALLFV